MASGQYLSVRSGAPTSLRAAAVLTASYVPTSSIDLGSYTSATLYLTIVSAAAETCTLKPQWSEDNFLTSASTFDEQYEVAGTASGTEQPFTSYSRTVLISLATGAPNYSSRFNREGRYFRVSLKSSGTTATISVAVQLSCLSN